MAFESNKDFDEQEGMETVMDEDLSLGEELDSNEDWNGSEDKESFPIQESSVIDSLPDKSSCTKREAKDSTCCLAIFNYSSTKCNSFSLVAVGSVDEKLRIYLMRNSQSLELLETFSECTDSIVSVKFSFDGKLLACGSYDSSVVVYSVEVQETTCHVELKHILVGPTLDVEWIEWHPQNYAVLCGSKDGMVWMWWAEDGSVLNVLTGHDGSVLCGGFANQGRLIVTGGADGSIMIWDPTTSQRLSQFTSLGSKKPGEHKMKTPSITCLATCHCPPLVAAGSEENTIRLINSETLKLLHIFEAHHDTVESLSFFQHDQNIQHHQPATFLVSAGLDGHCYVWNCSGTPSLEYRKISMAVYECSFSRFQCCFVLKHTDLVNVPCAPIVGGITRVVCFLSNKHTQCLATASTDCTLRVWDLSSQESLHVFTGHEAPLLDIGYSAAFHCLVSCSDDTTVKVWPLEF